MVFAQFDTQIKGIHLDNETEFSKGFLPSFLCNEGIIQQTSCVGTPPTEWSSRKERKNLHILNTIRDLML